MAGEGKFFIKPSEIVLTCRFSLLGIDSSVWVTGIMSLEKMTVDTSLLDTTCVIGLGAGAATNRNSTSLGVNVADRDLIPANKVARSGLPTRWFRFGGGWSGGFLGRGWRLAGVIGRVLSVSVRVVSLDNGQQAIKVVGAVSGSNQLPDEVGFTASWGKGSVEAMQVRRVVAESDQGFTAVEVAKKGLDAVEVWIG